MHHREDIQPLPSMLLFWKIYMDNVDPFLKVLHAPTMTKVIRELKGNHHSLGASMHALVLVISMAAIMSLGNEEVDDPYLRFNMSTRLIALLRGPCKFQH